MWQSWLKKYINLQKVQEKPTIAQWKRVSTTQSSAGPFFTKCALEKFDTYIFLARWLFSNESWWVMGDTDKTFYSYEITFLFYLWNFMVIILSFLWTFKQRSYIKLVVTLMPSLFQHFSFLWNIWQWLSHFNFQEKCISREHKSTHYILVSNFVIFKICQNSAKPRERCFQQN